METYYYNSGTVMKYLRKVLNIINSSYTDNSIRSAYIMKKFVEYYEYDEKKAINLVLLAFLKDIGNFYFDKYMDDGIDKAILSYTFLKYCSPIKEAAKPILFCGAKYSDNIDDETFNEGLLLHLVSKVANLIASECSLKEIQSELLKDDTNTLNPKQIKLLIDLLTKNEDIMDKLYQENSLYVHETNAFIQGAKYTDSELKDFINMVNYTFEFHSHETIAHSVTTSVIAKHLSELSRLSETKIKVVSLAALVHDIGKVKIPKEILSFPGKLNSDQLEVMRQHSTYSKEILEGCFSYQIVNLAYHHHEKLDGSGYPQGLTTMNLEIGDKILMISDFISALRSKRSYKERMGIDEIVSELHKEVFYKHFDARIVKHFEENKEEIIKDADEREEEIFNNYTNMNSESEALRGSAALLKIYGLEV